MNGPLLEARSITKSYGHGGRRKAILFTGLAQQAEMARNLAFLCELVEQGALVPLISSVHPVERAAEAHGSSRPAISAEVR